MNNKFLEKYPQLRKPKIGDTVKCLVRNFESFTFKVSDTRYDSKLNKTFYIITCSRYPPLSVTQDKIKII